MKKFIKDHCLFLGFALLAFTCGAQSLFAATIRTDKLDYAPAETAFITGSGWTPGETVVLEVDHVGQGTFGAGHEPWEVVADALGNVSSTWYVDPDDSGGATFLLTATGRTSTQVASWTFTDSVTSVTITSPTNASPVTLTTLPAIVAVKFNYETSPTGTTTADVDVLGTSITATATITPGTSNATVNVTIPAGTPNGDYNLKATVTNNTGSGSNQKNDNQNAAIKVALPTTAATTTSVASNQNPSTYGQLVTFTATVTSTSTPTGSVNFVIDGGSPVAGTAGSTTSTTATWTYTTSALNAATHTVSANYVHTGSFLDSSGSLSGGQLVNKANAVVVVTPYSVTYDGLSHSATVTSITGVAGQTGATVGTVDLSNTTHTDAGTYNSDSWNFTGTANYNNIAATTITDVINKANAVVVVTPYTVTYDGLSHSATVTSITGVAGQTGATVGTVDLSNTTHTDAGTFNTDSWSFTGTANYNNIAATTITDVINKANAVVVVAPYSVTYDSLSHSASVTSITGVAGQTGATVGTVDVSNTAHTDAGTYNSDSWSFTGTANYNNITATPITDVINKANAVVVVTPYTVTYDGLSHSATVTSITGVAGQTGATVGTVDVSNTAHTDAGTYNTDSWSFTGTANYNNIAATTITDVINKANAVIVVAPYSVTYDSLSHSATVTSITGVAGQTGATVGTVDLSNTTHTDAGTHNSDSWSFTGTANYNNIAPTTITDVINKANAVVVVTPYTVTYDGLSHSATVTSITGVAGQTGATVGTVDLSNTTHTDAGTHNTDSWSFTGTANYNNIAATTITDVINKANAVVVVTPYTVTYDGLSHSATVTSITGVAGQTGATVGTVDVSNTAHTDAGTYNSDSWSFTGTANYNNIAATTITDVINKANAVVVVTPYTVTYDGLSHSATVTSITGVAGQTGATVGTVDVSNTAHTDAGTYNSDSWSFTGTANYNNIAATTITDVINKANAVVVVAPYTVTYDGLSHTATVTSITGVAGQTGATVGTVNLSNTTHTDAGTYNSDSWSFTGTANYNNIAATTITDVINKANAVVVIAPYTVTYDGLSHTATVTSITGVAGQTGATVGTVNLSNTTHTDAGTYNSDSWSFTGTANYNNIAATTITDVINKANAVVVVAPYTVAYDSLPHSATVTSITGVAGQTGATVGTVNLSNTTHSSAGTYNSDSWSFTGTANYNNIAATTITDVINKAGLTITASNKGKECGLLLTFDTSSPSDDFSVSGLLGSDTVTNVSLSSAGAAASALACPSPSYPITVSAATGSGLANYSINYIPGTLTLTDTTAPAFTTLTLSPGGGPFAAGAQPITVSAAFLEICSVASVKFDWDDGTSTTFPNPQNPAIPTSPTAATHTYATAGVYSIKVTVTDGCGNYATQPLDQYVVIYDPTAGFVTGGGWILSPAGAYVPGPTLAGKAHFGFSSKYKKGQSIPTGETEFQFQMGNLNFHSAAYEWLVVSGPKGQFKGTGKVNGAGNYGFLLTATDGQLVSGPGAGTDRFRIKIWDKSAGDTVVYDNAPGGDDVDVAPTQAISGGSIVIQKN